MSEINYQSIIEAALFSAAEPLSIERIAQLFEEHEPIDNEKIQEIIASLTEAYQHSGVECVKVARHQYFLPPA